LLKSNQPPTASTPSINFRLSRPEIQDENWNVNSQKPTAMNLNKIEIPLTNLTISIKDSTTTTDPHLLVVIEGNPKKHAYFFLEGICYADAQQDPSLLMSIINLCKDIIRLRNLANQEPPFNPGPPVG
jgi:hypothetical protein